MPNAYEEMADLMLTTIAGKSTGLTREGLIQMFQTRFPDEAQFKREVKIAQDQAQAMLDKASALLQPGQALAVAFPVAPHQTH